MQQSVLALPDEVWFANTFSPFVKVQISLFEVFTNIGVVLTYGLCFCRFPQKKCCVFFLCAEAFRRPLVSFVLYTKLPLEGSNRFSTFAPVMFSETPQEIQTLQRPLHSLPADWCSMPKGRVLFLHITLPLYTRYIHILPPTPAMYDPLGAS